MECLRKNMKIFKEISVKLNSWKFIILVILIIISGAFYWYEWRPSKVYSYCDKWARETVKVEKEDYFKTYDFVYKICLREKGF